MMWEVLHFWDEGVYIPRTEVRGIGALPVQERHGSATRRVLYHVWFATKRRKWLLQGDVEEAAKDALLETAGNKGIDLLACETMVDHVHIMVRTEPGNLPRVMQFLKGISSKAVFEKFPEIKLDAGVDRF